MTGVVGGKAGYSDLIGEDETLSEDVLRFYEVLIDTVYADALECVNSQRHARHRDTSAISRADPDSCVRHFRIVSSLLYKKGMAALSASSPDFGLAERLFDDSISVIPSGVRYPEPFFFKLYLQITYDWPHEESSETARMLLEHDPHIAARAESLFSRVPKSLASSKVRSAMLTHISL